MLLAVVQQRWSIAELAQPCNDGQHAAAVSNCATQQRLDRLGLKHRFIQLLLRSSWVK